MANKFFFEDSEEQVISASENLFIYELPADFLRFPDHNLDLEVRFSLVGTGNYIAFYLFGVDMTGWAWMEFTSGSHTVLLNAKSTSDRVIKCTSLINGEEYLQIVASFWDTSIHSPSYVMWPNVLTRQYLKIEGFFPERFKGVQEQQWSCGCVAIGGDLVQACAPSQLVQPHPNLTPPPPFHSKQCFRIAQGG